MRPKKDQSAISYSFSQILFEAGFLRITLIPSTDFLLPQHKRDSVVRGGLGLVGGVARLATVRRHWIYSKMTSLYLWITGPRPS